jgi:hypothetical protein
MMMFFNGLPLQISGGTSSINFWPSGSSAVDPGKIGGIESFPPEPILDSVE